MQKKVNKHITAPLLSVLLILLMLRSRNLQVIKL
jgi:hypothetical protein